MKWRGFHIKRRVMPSGPRSSMSRLVWQWFPVAVPVEPM